MTERRTARTGELLRSWRRIRGRVQAEVATAVGISARHLSFIENGRTLPTESLVDRLGDEFEIPGHERALLHRSAGFSGADPQPTLDDEQTRRLRTLLDDVLRYLEPYPAAVMTRSFERIATNSALNRCILWLAGDSPYIRNGGNNMVELLIREDALRPVLKNWKDVAHRSLHRVYRESLLDDPHGELAELLERLRSLDGIPEDWQAPFQGDSNPLVRFVFEKDGRELTFDSMITTVGTPLDQSYQGIRLRYFVPIDDQAEQALARIVAS